MLCWGVVTNGIAHHINSSAFRTHRFFSINKKMERVVGEAYIISTSMIPVRPIRAYTQTSRTEPTPYHDQSFQ